MNVLSFLQLTLPNVFFSISLKATPETLLNYHASLVLISSFPLISCLAYRNKWDCPFIKHLPWAGNSSSYCSLLFFQASWKTIHLWKISTCFDFPIHCHSFCTNYFTETIVIDSFLVLNTDSLVAKSSLPLKYP